MLRTVLLFVLLVPWLPACGGPSYQRGSDDPSIDKAAMSTRLDRVDLEQALDKWYGGFANHPFVTQADPSKPRSISVLRIENQTSEHIASALSSLITSVETKLVNSGVFDVVSNDQVANDAILKELAAGDAVDPATMAAAGRRLGVRYFVYGNVGDTAEKTEDKRRVQYYLFLKVVEVETSKLVYQEQIDITKQISG